MQKVIVLSALIYGLSIESSENPLSLIKLSQQPLDIKIKEVKSSKEPTAKTIGISVVQNPTKLLELCSEIYDHLPVLTKTLDFKNENPFLLNLNDKEQVEHAKKLLKSLNIAKKDVLYQDRFSFLTYTSISWFSDAKLDFGYKKLQSLYTILLEIIKTTYIDLDSTAEQYQEPVNTIFDFVKENLGKRISHKNSNDGLAEEMVSKQFKEIFSIPIVPYDAVLVLAKVLSSQSVGLYEAWQNLNDNQRTTFDDFYTVYFKIKFLESVNFHENTKFFKNFIEQLQGKQPQFNNYNVENSFLKIFLSSITDEKTNKIDNKQITKKALIKMYESALHMIFLFGYIIEENYRLKEDMSIVEICGMFLKLQNGLEADLLPINNNAALEIEPYQSGLKTLQGYFVESYNKVKNRSSKKLNDANEYKKYVYDAWLERYKDNSYLKNLKNHEKYSYENIQFLFEPKVSILDALLNQKVPIERLDRNDCKLLFDIISDWKKQTGDNQKALPMPFAKLI